MIYPDRRDVLMWGAMLGLIAASDAASREPDELPDRTHDRPRRDVQTDSTSAVSKHDLSDSAALSGASFHALLRGWSILAESQSHDFGMKVRDPRLSEMNILQSLGTETEVPASYLGSRYNEYSYDSWRRPFDHAAEGYLDKTIGIVRETTVSGEFRERTPEEISRLIHLPIEFTGNYLEFQDLNTRTHSIAGEVLRPAGKLITVYQEYLAASSPTDFELALSKAVAVGFRGRIRRWRNARAHGHAINGGRRIFCNSNSNRSHGQRVPDTVCSRRARVERTSRLSQ
jgi:hypothetical protein